MKRKAEPDLEDADARAKLERPMDSSKEVGSKAIGAGQVAIAAGEDLANRTSSRLQDAFYKVSYPFHVRGSLGAPARNKCIAVV